jgi:hypothetical protein
MTTLRIVCAWCGRKLGEKDGQGIDGLSHSICDKCLRKLLAVEATREYQKATRYEKTEERR